MCAVCGVLLFVCVHVVLCRCVCCVLCGCVLCWCWCLVVVVLCCVGVVCCVGGVCVCVFCLFLCCFAFFSQFSSFSFLLSLFPSSLYLSFFSLLSSLPLPLLSSLLATKHCGKNRSTNTAANFEAFECDLAHGKCTAVGSFPPPFTSLLPSLPLLLKKMEGLLNTGIFPATNLFFITVLNKFQKLAAGENYRHYSFILIPKQLVCNASKL